MWMGHDPGVDQEFVGDKVHPSQEGDDPRVEILPRDLSHLLSQAREQLLDLLTLVEVREGSEVATLLDRDLHITDQFP